MLDINYLQNYLEIQLCDRPVLNKAPSSNSLKEIIMYVLYMTTPLLLFTLTD